MHSMFTACDGGCSATEPTPIADLEDTTVKLSKPISVSFALDVSSEMRMPFDLSISKTAIKVKHDGKNDEYFTVALHRADNDAEVAIAEISNAKKTITFTNLVSSNDYYLVVINQRDTAANLILELSEQLA